jgi:hypothetical protein
VEWGGSYKNITHEPNEKERRNSESNVNKKEKKKISREEDVLDSGPHIPKRQECPLLLLIQKVFGVSFWWGFEIDAKGPRPKRSNWRRINSNRSR